MSFWKKIFGEGSSQSAGSAPRDEKRYAQERTKANSENIKDRMSLAKDSKTHQEILYYMAQNDPDPSVRAAVANNKSTPVQASSVLSQDQDQDVRLTLALRLMNLLPDLSKDKQSQLYAFVVQSLGVLALDEVLKIRLALSSVLKDHAFAPAQVVGQLARDIEREVSEPILRFCLALSDEDLLDILKSHPEGWAVEAIAARPEVSEPVSQGIIDTDNAPAGTILMNNGGANISQKTMSGIVEKAKKITAWQKPIAMRKNLSPDLARELAGFVDLSIKNLLLERTDFDLDVMDEISTIVVRRLEFMDEKEHGQLSPEERVRKLAARGQLGDDLLTDALAVHDREFVILSLAFLAKTSRVTVEKVIAMNTPKPLIALCWKAGLSMRTAFRMEKELSRIPSNELIYPRGGTDYPLSEKDILWQLEFLGVAYP